MSEKKKGDAGVSRHAIVNERRRIRYWQRSANGTVAVLYAQAMLHVLDWIESDGKERRPSDVLREVTQIVIAQKQNNPKESP